MTIQGAIYELNNMLSSNDIPCYWKPAIKKIIETVEQNVGEISEQTDGDLIGRKDLLKELEKWDWQDTYLPIHFAELVADLPSAEKTTLSAEKTTITDGDLISRDKAIELVNYALAENKDVLEVLENMPSAEK